TAVRPRSGPRARRFGFASDRGRASGRRGLTRGAASRLGEGIMARWSNGAALLAVWVMGGAAARAQGVPARGPAPGMPEPLPGAAARPRAGPVAAVGAMTAGPGACAAGGGGCDTDLSLPANTPTAWDDREPTCPACYAYFGGMGLARQRPGRGAGPVAIIGQG